MSKVSIVYWSGTGNTQKMAEAVAEGVKEAGAEAVFFLTACIGTEREGGMQETEAIGERHGKRKPDPYNDRHSGL